MVGAPQKCPGDGLGADPERYRYSYNQTPCSGIKKRGLLEGGHCKTISLSWLWRSEPSVLLGPISLGIFFTWARRCKKKSFAKTPFLDS